MSVTIFKLFWFLTVLVPTLIGISVGYAVGKRKKAS